MKKTTAQAKTVIANYKQLSDPKPATKPTKAPQQPPTEATPTKPETKKTGNKNAKNNLSA